MRSLPTSMTNDKNHILKLNIEGGKSVELNLSKERFEKLAEFCHSYFPDKQWKTKSISQVEV